MKFGQLILRRIVKIVATKCQTLRLKCTKIVFGWGSASDPAGGAYSAPPDPLPGRGPTSKGNGYRKGGEEGEGGEGRVRGRRGGEGKGGNEGRGGYPVCIFKFSLE